jgi:hypothetical protein
MMETPNTTALARIWADATPLARFIEDRAQSLCRKPDGAEPAKDAKSSSTARLAYYLQLQTNLMSARDSARTITKNDLVAGRLVGLGRASGSYAIEAIDPSFWIGAEIDGDNAVRDNKKVIEIRIPKSEAIPSLKLRSQPESGRPSKAEVIRAAIADYAKSDPGLDRPRLGRFRRYREFITAQGFDPRKDDGFGDKTLEKYEGEHRKKFS